MGPRHPRHQYARSQWHRYPAAYSRGLPQYPCSRDEWLLRETVCDQRVTRRRLRLSRQGQAPEEFMRAVHTVLSGRRFVSATLSEMLVSALDEPTDQPLHAGLSQREFQILCKLAVGRSVSEIAEELFISVKTVSTYRARVLEKMNLDTNADLTAYALRNGLVQ